jgi:Ca2+-binding EF-hand superfamily protein
MQDHGRLMRDQEIDMVFSLLDKNGDGFIDFREFAAIFQQTPNQPKLSSQKKERSASG